MSILKILNGQVGPHCAVTTRFLSSKDRRRVLEIDEVCVQANIDVGGYCWEKLLLGKDVKWEGTINLRNEEQMVYLHDYLQDR